MLYHAMRVADLPLIVYSHSNGRVREHTNITQYNLVCMYEVVTEGRVL